QVVVAQSGIGMLLPPNLLKDGEGFLVQGQRLGVLALSVQAEGHEAVAKGGIGMLLPQDLLENGESLTPFHLRLAIAEVLYQLTTLEYNFQPTHYFRAILCGPLPRLNLPARIDHFPVAVPLSLGTIIGDLLPRLHGVLELARK